MGLKRIEQEVIISFNAMEELATIYTSYPPYIRKLDKLSKDFPSFCKAIGETRCDNELISKTYTIYKKLINVRKPRDSTPTDEEL